MNSSIGTGARARYDATREIISRTPRKFDPPRDDNGRRLRISEFFGMNTLDSHQMREKLPKDVFEKMRSTIEQGKTLDPDISGPIAHAIKEWALSKGVTHFCHWFQPQTGSTAEKHDAFLTLDENKRPIEKFSGSQLIQSEPDASSFPSGGMRTTFEARGYTAWDPSSPVFIMESASVKTLCIPSVFISHHGHALDEKTGLMRSTEILSQRLCELLTLIGTKGVQRVIPTLGVEQEYFLIDRAYASLRPDILMAGRTIVGGHPPKGQQLEDHYFGSIAARVQSFMSEMEHELYKLGVPVKTRHNEVAPAQFESAPIFEEAGIATDHNQLVMEVTRKVAIRHGFTALLHEKPFAGINGSGKHCNWSLAIASSEPELDGLNLLEPGKTPHQNMRFLLILCAILRGVHKHAGLLRAGVASAANDHRLGANEAPPAIMSVFLGDMLNNILDEIERGTGHDRNLEAAVIRLGVSRLPEIMRDNTDRNRTSPFAFTGNKFEFRAVGSSASVAFPTTLVNAAVADGLSSVITSLKKRMQDGASLDSAIQETLREVITATKPIRFEGNNYSEEWVREAERRGLPNLRKTPEALRQMVADSSKEALVGQGIFSEAELTSRYHVRVELYVKKIMIEVETLQAMVDTQILPACYAYHGMLAAGAAAAKAVGMQIPQSDTLSKLASLCNSLQASKLKMEQVFNKAEGIASEEEKAAFFAKEMTVSMSEVRSYCDEIEALVADDYWPLPKYREMLFQM